MVVVIIVMTMMVVKVRLMVKVLHLWVNYDWTWTWVQYIKDVFYFEMATPGHIEAMMVLLMAEVLSLPVQKG